MDLISCMYHLRPDVTWKDNFVNGVSLEAIAETYQSSQPIPTTEECVAAWVEIITKQEAEAVRLDDIALEQSSNNFKSITIQEAHSYIDNQINEITSVATAKTQLKKVLKRIVPFLLE